MNRIQDLTNKIISLIGKKDEAVRVDLKVVNDNLQLATQNTNNAIALERERIDAILEASDADKDSFAEVVALINSIDAENGKDLTDFMIEIKNRVALIETDLSEYKNSNNARVQAIEDDLAGALAAIDTALNPPV